MKELDKFYLKQDEPIRGCFHALSVIILAQDLNVTNEWKYGDSFFVIKVRFFAIYGTTKNTNSLILEL